MEKSIEVSRKWCPKCGKQMEVKEGFDLGSCVATCPLCGHQKTFTDVDGDWEREYEMRFMRPSKIL